MNPLQNLFKLLGNDPARSSGAAPSQSGGMSDALRGAAGGMIESYVGWPGAGKSALEILDAISDSGILSNVDPIDVEEIASDINPADRNPPPAIPWAAEASSPAADILSSGTPRGKIPTADAIKAIRATDGGKSRRSAPRPSNDADFAAFKAAEEAEAARAVNEAAKLDVPDEFLMPPSAAQAAASASPPALPRSADTAPITTGETEVIPHWAKRKPGQGRTDVVSPAMPGEALDVAEIISGSGGGAGKPPVGGGANLALPALPGGAGGAGGTGALSGMLSSAGPIGLALGAKLAGDALVNSQFDQVKGGIGTATTALMGDAAGGKAGAAIGGAVDAAKPLGLMELLNPAQALADRFTGIVKAGKDLPAAIMEWADTLADSRRALAQYSETMATVFAQSKTRETIRNIGSAQRTSGTTADLLDSINDIRDAMQPFKDDITNILNRIATGTLETGKTAIEWYRRMHIMDDVLLSALEFFGKEKELKDGAMNADFEATLSVMSGLDGDLKRRRVRRGKAR